MSTIDPSINQEPETLEQLISRIQGLYRKEAQAGVERLELRNEIRNALWKLGVNFELDELIQKQNAWMDKAIPDLVSKMVGILSSKVEKTRLNSQQQETLARLLLKVLRLVGNSLQEGQGSNFETCLLEVVAPCLRFIRNTDFRSYIHEWVDLYYLSEYPAWRKIWLRFFAGLGLHTLESEAASRWLDAEELIAGSMICYLADIRSRKGFDDIMSLITPEPAYLRSRALYYLWQLKSKDFYSRIFKVEGASSGKILISDDNELLAATMPQIIKTLGYECVVEVSPIKTLSLLRDDESFSLLITDIDKPEMDGIEMIARIRELDRAAYLPTVIRSAYPLEYVNELCLGANTLLDLAVIKHVDRQILANELNFILIRDAYGLTQYFQENPEVNVFQYLDK